MSQAQVHHTASASLSSGTDDLAGRLYGVLTTHVARVLFALPFAVFGLFHFKGGDAMAGMVPVPGGVFWVYFTGVALIAAAGGIAFKILGQWAALGLALLMVLFALTVHLPGLGHPETAQLSMISLLKDLALAGAALGWAGVLSREAR